ncbi:MAG: hypothetical protein AAGB22_13410, partial [Bacteroidota bacterium]
VAEQGIVSGVIRTDTGAVGPYYTGNDPLFGYGYIKYEMNKAMGGGIRVKAITARETATGQAYTTEFNYSGGIATAEPDRFAPVKGAQYLEKSKHGGDRHSLPPSVGYSQVDVRHKGMAGNYLGRTSYHFKNYYEPFTPQTTTVKRLDGSGTQYFRIWEVTRVVSSIQNMGKLEEMKQYDTNDDLIAFTRHEYESNWEKMGKTEEAFYRGIHFTNANTNGDITYIRSVFFKTDLYAPLKRTTTMVDGIENTIEWLERDKFTGVATHIRRFDRTNGSWDQYSVPAYTLHSLMGPKTANAGGANLLFHTATETTERNGQLTVGTHSEWDNHFPVREFSGSAFITNFHSHVFLPEVQRLYNGNPLTANWKKIGEITLLDGRYHVVEQRGHDNTYSASRYGHNDRFEIASVDNANFASFTCTGFE